MSSKGSGVLQGNRGSDEGRPVCDERPGVQEWTDGSRYEGDFRHGLKHGNGAFTWPNGEVRLTISL